MMPKLYVFKTDDGSFLISPRRSYVMQYHLAWRGEVPDSILFGLDPELLIFA